jgi:hypothetical protein
MGGMINWGIFKRHFWGELHRHQQTVSPAGVRCVWLRHDLETLNKRLKALEAKSAQKGLVLTEAQLVALEKAKTEKEAHGEFESEHPAYCGAHDKFYVGKSQGSWARLSADLHRHLHLHQGRLRQALRSQDAGRGGRSALPFFEEHDVKLLSVLTDRGSEFCGNPNGTSTSSISRSRTSITRAPRPRARRRTASVNASTRPRSTGSGMLVLRQNPDADLPGCNADDEEENDRGLTERMPKPDRSTRHRLSDRIPANTRERHRHWSGG